ncbi:flagellar biosynthetic protein FliO [Simkania sp.]|uniref:flagellar biosynthetic protein FliO n=1 Tax=Simkania sp. TaxID=34094 RepID=UPI003B52486C
MKWYQYFLFLLLLWAPLQGAEEPTQGFQQTLVADQKDTPQDPSKPKQAPNPDKPVDHDDKAVPSEEAEDQPDESDIKKATESVETAFIKTIVVLVGLLVLVILTVWMFKKISHGRLRSFNYMKSIKILEKRPLSPKSMLYLVEVGGKQVLLAESQLQVKNVATLDWIGTDKDL